MNGVIGIVGLSGSGKTTLICGIIRSLDDVRVTVIKRTHHLVPGFTGGKDTDLYLDAGASEAILVTPRNLHHWHGDTHNESPLRPVEDVVTTASSSADLVIIESAKYDGTWPRLLVHASSIGLPDPLPPRLAAVVSDESIVLGEDLPHFDRNEIEKIARFVIRITS